MPCTFMHDIVKVYFPISETGQGYVKEVAPMSSPAAIEALFLEFCLCNPQGASDKEFRTKYPEVSAVDLVNVINSLVSQGKIQLFKSGDGLVYKASSTFGETDQAQTLEGDERIVYQCIKSTDNKGIWTRDLKSRTNLHQTIITKVLRSLESKKLVKSVKSVKNSTRKVYMLYHLEPSVDLTGGPWFSENELDIEFIEEMCKICYRYIISQSVAKQANAILPADFADYPDLSQVIRFIEESGVTSANLAPEDVSMLLDRLIYDGKIEKIVSLALVPSRIIDDDEDDNIYVYKARSGHGACAESALNSIPCGSCPIFQQCSDIGPVTPQKCEYFVEWLAF